MRAEHKRLKCIAMAAIVLPGLLKSDSTARMRG